MTSHFFAPLLALVIFCQPLSAQELTVGDSLAIFRLKRAHWYAKKYNDPLVARTLLYQIHAINPRDLSSLDSLAVSYFEYQNYSSAALLTRDLVSFSPDDTLALEIAARSFLALGVKDKALDYLESLHLKNDSPKLLYDIAYVQYELGRVEQARGSSEILLGHPELDSKEVILSTENGSSQAIPLKAAVYRLMSKLAEGDSDKQKARELMGKALEIAPDFAAATKELEELGKDP